MLSKIKLKSKSYCPVNRKTHSFSYSTICNCILLGHYNSNMLLLSHFSRVRLCVTPQTAAHQAPLSLGFSRQEHWSGLPFPSPMQESEKVKVKSLSRVWLLATPWTAAYQAPASMGFSRQEYWSGVPSPSPIVSYANHYITNASPNSVKFLFFLQGLIPCHHRGKPVLVSLGRCDLFVFDDPWHLVGPT